MIHKRFTIVRIILTISIVIFISLLILDYQNDSPHYGHISVKKDWRDHDSIKEQLLRKGLGEQGHSAMVIDPKTGKQILEYDKYGINMQLSEYISSNRSVPDIQIEKCRTKKYLVNLPKVSVIMTFLDENWSTIIRACHSILNRTPPELLEEIILVNDHSVAEDLGQKLLDYIKVYLPKVRVINLFDKSGPVQARVVGAKKAKSEILVFLDTQIETNYNWLPPLIEPIVLNPKTVSCPVMDKISNKDFKYLHIQPQRGGFTWELQFKQIQVLPENTLDISLPYNNPIIFDGSFAIRADFFWELGGHDPQIVYWKYEKIEFSFKIWMCGGLIINVPCSRIARVTKTEKFDSELETENVKRIAEAWMDDYKTTVYGQNLEKYQNIKLSDISKEVEIRNTLKCKPFKWYLENIAFDSVDSHKVEKHPDFAMGSIQNVADKKLCLREDDKNKIKLMPCFENNIKDPSKNEDWILNHLYKITNRFQALCLEGSIQNPLVLRKCIKDKDNQEWIYNYRTKWIFHLDSARCIDSNIENKTIFLSNCEYNQKSLQWNFGWINESLLGPKRNRSLRV